MALEKRIPPLIILFVSLLASLPGRAEQKGIRGFVIDLPSPTSFRVDDSTIQLTDKTRIEYPPGQEGVLRIGSEVEAWGSYDKWQKLLLADRIVVLPPPSGPVRGTAVLELAPESLSQGLLLYADGRRIQIGEHTRLFERKNEGQDTPTSLTDLTQKLLPGNYVEYEGTISSEGQVTAERIALWSNTTEKAEAKLLEEYRPRLHLSQKAGSPTTLWVHKWKYKLYPNDIVQRYVDRVGTRLVSTLRHEAANNPISHLNFQFFLADSHKLGATAYPNGVVVIHSGLLYGIENEAQLAFLLGHEIAHATQEHAWRQWGYHRRKFAVVRWASAYLSWVVEQAVRKGYERELENQADRLALAYMARAGYDPREGYRFLRNLQKSLPISPSPLLWGSHDSFTSRRGSLMAVINTTHRELAFDGLDRGLESFEGVRLHLPQAKIKARTEKVPRGATRE